MLRILLYSKRATLSLGILYGASSKVINADKLQFIIRIITELHIKCQIQQFYIMNYLIIKS